MAVPLRLTAFALALVATFGLSFGVGKVTGDPSGPADEVHAGTGEGDHPDGHPAGDGEAPGRGRGDHGMEGGG